MTKTTKLLHQYLKQTHTPSDSVLIFDANLRDKIVRKRQAAAKKVQAPAPKPILQTAPAQKKPAPKPKPPVKQEAPKVAMEKQPQAAAIDPSSFSSLYAKIAPHTPVHKTPPKDTIAMKVKDAHKDDEALITVPIFATMHVKEHLPLLKNLAKAIDTLLAPSRVINITEIEEADRWTHILTHEVPKLFLVPDVILFQSKNLITHYSEVGQTLFKRLEETPTLVLKDLHLYYKTPAIKQSLWKILKEQIPKLYER